MAELSAKSAFSSALPKTIGATTLNQVDLGKITSVAAYQGDVSDLSDSLQQAHGLALAPALGSSRSTNMTCLWAGKDLWFLIGGALDLDVSQWAAVTDQSDAWVAVRLDGEGATQVLARLVPIDLRASHFGEGAVVRTVLGHLNVVIARLDGGFLILAFRSMADTLAHDLIDAMTSVAGREKAQ